jgi:hypothetical protein
VERPGENTRQGDSSFNNFRRVVCWLLRVMIHYFPFFSSQGGIYNKESTNIQSPGSHSAAKSLSSTKVAAKNFQSPDISPYCSATWLPAFGLDFSTLRMIGNRRYLTCVLNFKRAFRGGQDTPTPFLQRW